MARSFERLLLFGTFVAIFLVACQTLIGIDKYKKESDACVFTNCVQPPDDNYVPDSGVEYFGDASAAHRWVAWPMPNPPTGEVDANLMSYTPSTIDAGEAGVVMVVHDNVTGLNWLKDPLAGKTYLEATAYCASLGSDFRLPTRIELVSLWDYTKPSTAFDMTAFTGTGGEYWTQSPALPDQTSAWVFDFGGGGRLQSKPVGEQALVRCVR